MRKAKMKTKVMLAIALAIVAGGVVQGESAGARIPGGVSEGSKEVCAKKVVEIFGQTIDAMVNVKTM